MFIFMKKSILIVRFKCENNPVELLHYFILCISS